jgi:hypothetical protein
MRPAFEFKDRRSATLFVGFATLFVGILKAGAGRPPQRLNADQMAK